MCIMSYQGYIFQSKAWLDYVFNKNIFVYTCLFKLPTAYAMSRRYMHLAKLDMLLAVHNLPLITALNLSLGCMKTSFMTFHKVYAIG
jgi:hypothetical protein